MITPLKIAIASPARDQVHTLYATSLAAMLRHTTAQRPEITIDTYTILGTLIFNQRMELATQAIQQNCDYILWLDTDMRFPPDTLLRLLAHQLDIVAANCVTRQIPVRPTAANWIGPPHLWKRVLTLPASTGLENVDAAGTAVMLTDIRVIRKLAAKDEPIFWFQYLAKDRVTISEDYYFCLNARRQGFTISIDHDLSKEIKHVGTFEFGHEHVNPAVVELPSEEA
jgi:hypothetical protein